MTDDEQDHGSEDFDDPSHAEVRALLGEAAATEPLPEDVAAMLGETLDALVADRAAPDSPVVPLVRRRGLPGRRLLSAAAAVVLLGGIGVGMTQVLGTSGDDNATSSADSQSLAEAPVAPGGTVAESAPGAGTGGTTTKDDQASQVRSLSARLASTDFTEAQFTEQLADLSAWAAGRAPSDPSPELTSGNGDGVLSGSGGSAPGSSYDSGAQKRFSGLAALQNLALPYQAAAGCTGPEIAQGSVVLGITFEGEPAALVLHPVVDGSRYVAAWSCNGHELLAFATVPA